MLEVTVHSVHIHHLISHLTVTHGPRTWDIPCTYEQARAIRPGDVVRVSVEATGRREP